VAAFVRRWRRLAYDARDLPVLGSVVATAYRRYFNNACGPVRLFRGLYPNFVEAARDIPAGRLFSYDNEASATRVLDEWLGVYPNDYPVMFWLAKLLRERSFVFDWGGNVGLKYFAYRRFIDYPQNLVWLVAEVPAVVEVGRKIALRESAGAVRFTTELDELGGADVLLAAGVLHFIDDPLARLRAMSQLPRHLLLNKVPAYEMPSAVTLQNMGTAFCPYHLFNRRELVGRIEALGYRQVDDWNSPDVSCEIPFFPKHSIDAYSGFYFVRND
jgi:putative methyltransferase (TIGR04325 family)